MTTPNHNLPRIPTHDEVLNDILNYIKLNNMTPASFGRKHLNDSGAVLRLSNGVDPRLSTLHKIYEVLNAPCS